MRAIVIGHTGLIGSAIAAHLRSVGVEVLGVDRSNYAGVRGTRADVVVNAGGSPDKRSAAEHPLESYRTNVEGTVAAIHDFPSRQFVHVSTVSVYADPADPARTPEDAPIDPGTLSPYGAFKYMAEIAVRALAERWSIVRLGPVVGPGLRRNAIHDLIERGSLYVSPESRLCYIDSATVARAAWELREPDGHVHNVAGQGTVRLADVARDLSITLDPVLWTLPTERMEVDVSKALRRLALPSTEEVVRAFVAARRGARSSYPETLSPGSSTASPSRR